MQSEYRLKIQQKITEYEKQGLFNKDVEDDPETKTLMPDDVDYLAKKFKSRLFTKIANKVAVYYYEKQLKKGDYVIKEINGLENFQQVKGGAIITCNHFSPTDNYTVYRSIKDSLPKGKYLYKVIREGNYTNFKGLFGFFFRNCNTLPLSSNIDTMKKFMRSLSVLLERGEKVLIYPEQAMWYNYKKPRPLKPGAFNLASKNNVPVIPAFITLSDGEKIDADGLKVQEQTIWFLPPIYPDKNLSVKENTQFLMDKNYQLWKDLYEQVYGKKLVYGEDL